MILGACNHLSCLLSQAGIQSVGVCHNVYISIQYTVGNWCLVTTSSYMMVKQAPQIYLPEPSNSSYFSHENGQSISICSGKYCLCQADPQLSFLNLFMFQHSNINELVCVPELHYKCNRKFYCQYVRSHLEKFVASYFKYTPAFCRSRIWVQSWSFSHVPALLLPVVSLILNTAQER